MKINELKPSKISESDPDIVYFIIILLLFALIFLIIKDDIDYILYIKVFTTPICFCGTIFYVHRKHKEDYKKDMLSLESIICNNYFKHKESFDKNFDLMSGECKHLPKYVVRMKAYVNIFPNVLDGIYHADFSCLTISDKDTLYKLSEFFDRVSKTSELNLYREVVSNEYIKNSKLAAQLVSEFIERINSIKILKTNYKGNETELLEALEALEVLVLGCVNFYPHEVVEPFNIINIIAIHKNIKTIEGGSLCKNININGIDGNKIAVIIHSKNKIRLRELYDEVNKANKCRDIHSIQEVVELFDRRQSHNYMMHCVNNEHEKFPIVGFDELLNLLSPYIEA